jgi:hypothetical protein
MRISHAHALLIAALPALACASAPARSRPPEAPRAPSFRPPDPEMAALDFYEGSWSCRTYDYPGGKKTEGPAATVRVARVLGGHWYKVEVDIAPSEAEPAGWHTEEYKGYDPEFKKWVHLALADVPGGWVRPVVSDGLRDNKMIWTPLEPQPGPPQRAIMTRLSDSEYDHVAEEDGGAGFAPAWSKRCLKVVR